MTGPWWRGISPVQAQVVCGDRQHRLRWAAGQMQALDHTDLEGERILAALGGRCACADLTQLWARHSTDIRTLVATSRGEGDPVPDPAAVSIRPHRLGTRHRAADLAELLDLGGLMQDRLTATVAAAWRDRLRDGLAQRERAALHAALYGRATAALRSWTRRPDLEVELAMIGDDQPPRLTGDSDGITAELPFSWIVEVWARGLTIVWGRFCLGAAPAETGWILSTVGPELGPPAPVAVGSPAED